MTMTAETGTLHGKVRYFQDFAFWEHEFPDDLIFTKCLVGKDIWLRAPGYGEHGNYGNGAIILLPGELNRSWKPLNIEYGGHA